MGGNPRPFGVLYVFMFDCSTDRAEGNSMKNWNYKERPFPYTIDNGEKR